MTIADHMIDSLMVENDDLRERIVELEDENARLDQTRRSLHAEIEKLGGIIHRQRKQLAEVQDALERRNAENDKLRELVRGLHMAYVGAINKCENLDESLIWEFSGNIDDDVAKSKEEYESDRHRFDVAMRELGVTDD